MIFKLFLKRLLERLSLQFTFLFSIVFAFSLFVLVYFGLVQIGHTMLKVGAWEKISDLNLHKMTMQMSSIKWLRGNMNPICLANLYSTLLSQTILRSSRQAQVRMLPLHFQASQGCGNCLDTASGSHCEVLAGRNGNLFLVLSLGLKGVGGSTFFQNLWKGSLIWNEALFCFVLFCTQKQIDNFK